MENKTEKKNHPFADVAADFMNMFFVLAVVFSFFYVAETGFGFGAAGIYIQRGGF